MSSSLSQHSFPYLLFFFFVGYGQDKCKQSLGLSNSSIIKDEQFSCSSFLYDYVARAYHYRPYHGRLHGTEGAGAWCSSDKLRGEYLQVDFLRNTVVTYVETQGRYRGAEYTGKYKVAYLRDADKTWKIVRNGKGEEQVCAMFYIRTAVS